MWNFRRRNQGADRGGTAVAERPGPDFDELTEPELQAAIAELTEAERGRRSLQSEQRLLTLRHHLGLRRVRAATERPEFVAADPTALPVVDSGLPEIAAADLSPGLIRAGILRDGCLLVRGLIEREAALEFADLIDRGFTERERHDSGGSVTPGFYEEFQPAPGSGQPIAREWIKMGGGVLAADSPMLAARMFELFSAAGLPAIVGEYLGEPPLISVDKTTLRKAAPSVPGAWHQDGAFMGDVRALNLWLSLSRCGDESPGLDVVPRRLDELVSTGTDEAMLNYQVSQRMAEDAAGDKPIIRPIFEPGDALFFDDLFLHQTGSDPSMPKPRFAIENWFFGGSAFPADYSPIAV